MSKIWKSNNYFFDPIIKEYFKKNPGLELSPALWYRDTPRLDFFDVDYYSKKRCRKCRVTSQLTNIQMLSNKKLQYQKLLDFKGERPDYLPETIPFTRDSMHELTGYFNNTRQWIIKPIGGSFRKGVTVVKTHDELVKAVNETKSKNWVLQQFINNPALCHGKKFHFRVYALVVKQDSNLDVYMYRQGIMYFAQKPYQLSETHPDDGQSGQKPASEEEKAEALLSGGLSTENSFVFPEKFAECFNQHLFDYNIFPQMCHIVQDTIMSVQNEIMCPNRTRDGYKCFKLLGYDILCDQNFQLYLGEINARRITFKYPPEWMKKQLYNNLLDIVLKDNVDGDNQFYHLKNYQIKERDMVALGGSGMGLGFRMKKKDYIVLVICLLVCVISYYLIYGVKMGKGARGKRLKLK